MKKILDFHIHSKYSRATSPKMEVVSLDYWAKIKGIDILATGDITHPQYLKELKENLVEDGSGLLKLKNLRTEELKNVYKGGETSTSRLLSKNFPPFLAVGTTKFILSGEIACIYKQGDKCRRVHLCVLVPDFQTIEKINLELNKRNCNLRSDGRPIIGLSAKDLLEICLEANEKTIMIPAHIWTPWFAVFGSKSGFDSLEDCFGDLTKYIYAVETGLSSDPLMNWRLSQLDNITLVSNSDAHSPDNLGREANVMDLENESYDEILQILKTQDSKKILHTIEFYPEEGKYHYDGHANCDFFCTPEESLKYKNICPKCKKPLTLGVDHRVEALADVDRKLGFQPKNQIPFKYIIPLKEILSEICEVGKKSKKVNGLYEKMIEKGGNEFKILLDLNKEQLKNISNDLVSEAIIRMREGQVYKQPGYDGVFGIIKVFKPGELDKLKPKQDRLF